MGNIELGISAIRALERGQQEAVAMSHSYTGTEHLLLGLMSEESGGAATMFAVHKVDAAKVRWEILHEYGQV